MCERVTRTTCGSWLRISRSHSYDSPLACVLRSSPRIVELKRVCSQSERMRSIFRDKYFFPPRRPYAIHQVHAQTARIACSFSRKTFWWSLFYVPDLFINMTLCHPQPIPVENLLVEDLSDGDARMGGSFKTAISRLGTGE